MIEDKPSPPIRWYFDVGRVIFDGPKVLHVFNPDLGEVREVLDVDVQYSSEVIIMSKEDMGLSQFTILFPAC